MDLDTIKGPVHFVGIGGIGMSALAQLLLARGKKVSGSDKKESEITQELQDAGCDIHIGHASGNFSNVAALVVSTAITSDNPELIKAKELGIPVLHRSEMLSELTRGRKLIGVSGTHGKTTTTGMVAQVLIDGQLDPSVVVGGIFGKIKSNARHGASDLFVAEIDESDGTQTAVKSYYSIITNIETDHLENYPGGLDEIIRSMKTFAAKSEKGVIICADDPSCMALYKDLQSQSALQLFTYGKKDAKGEVNFAFESVSAFGIKVFHNGKELGELQLSVPGDHNKYNALAAVAVGILLGLDFETIKKSLRTFTGVNRRFQILGEESSVMVVDDYAHHPTEVVATLQGARQFIDENRVCSKNGKGRLVAFFQPHQPSRLQNHWNEFLKCFEEADVVLISDIYVARGKVIEGVSSERFVKELKHKNAHYISGSTSELAGKVLPFLQPNDLIMTIGAGDITSVGPELLDLLKKQK